MRTSAPEPGLPMPLHLRCPPSLPDKNHSVHSPKYFPARKQSLSPSQIEAITIQSTIVRHPRLTSWN
jgi:hypothetical protein